METEGPKLDVGNLLQDTVALLLWNRWRTITALAVLAGIGIGFDLAGQDANLNSLSYNVAALGLQMWLTVALLNDAGARVPGTGGFGGLFVVSLAAQIGVILGLAFFILPGVILFVRWSLGVPIVLSERVSPKAALWRSWEQTEKHFWPILAVLAVIYVPLGILGFGLTVAMADSAPTLSSIVLNGCITIMLVAGWHAAVAIFLASRVKPHSLEEVFA